MRQLDQIDPLSDEPPSRGEAALLSLLHRLKSQGYHFVTPTPSSHEHVLARAPARLAGNVRDIFGWSLSFPPKALDAELLTLLEGSGMVERGGGLLKSRIRVSSLGPDLYLHSAYPTDDKEAVFFGPDSYRFARFNERELRNCPLRPGARLVDIGTGAGVGAIVGAHCCPNVEIIMTDINPAALRLARLNAQAAGVKAQFHLASELGHIPGELDIVLANPPFIIDEHGRDYRDGANFTGRRSHWPWPGKRYRDWRLAGASSSIQAAR